MTHQVESFDPAIAAVRQLDSDTRARLAGGVVATLLHGSFVLNDYAPGFSDLDFVVVLVAEPSPADCQALQAMRASYRAGGHGEWARALEGVFLPRTLLTPGTRGYAVGWGTRGERVWESCQLSWFDVAVIRAYGQTVVGEDVTTAFPEPPQAALLAEVRAFLASARAHGQGGRLKSIDWLLTAARLLRWLHDGELCSKTAAADWAAEHAQGDWWVDLPRARDLRRRPAQAQEAATQAWLATLRPAIASACAELDAALNR